MITKYQLPWLVLENTEVKTYPQRDYRLAQKIDIIKIISNVSCSQEKKCRMLGENTTQSERIIILKYRQMLLISLMFAHFCLRP